LAGQLHRESEHTFRGARVKESIWQANHNLQ
jgi:hypothetical protein